MLPNDVPWALIDGKDWHEGDEFDHGVDGKVVGGENFADGKNDGYDNRDDKGWFSAFEVSKVAEQGCSKNQACSSISEQVSWNGLQVTNPVIVCDSSVVKGTDRNFMTNYLKILITVMSEKVRLLENTLLNEGMLSDASLLAHTLSAVPDNSQESLACTPLRADSTNMEASTAIQFETQEGPKS